MRALNDILVSTFPEAIIKKPHVYIKEISNCLAKKCGGQSFVRIDVENFFPSIDRTILFKQVQKRIRKKSLKYILETAVTNETSGLENTGKGVPQGLSISNILSSINLTELDKKLRKKYQYFRYVDDILVICSTKRSRDVFYEIESELNALGLTCHSPGTEGKSSISAVSKGVEYLGFHITPENISVRHTSYLRMFEKLLGVLTTHKHRESKKKNDGMLVWRLNFKITGCRYQGKRFGWMFFFSQIDNLRQLGRLDAFVNRELNIRGLSSLRPNIKKFIKSYHEIRNNLKQTTYIPNYDDYDIEDMIHELVQAEGNDESYYRSRMTKENVEARFHKLIGRHTRMLEQDLIELRS